MSVTVKNKRVPLSPNSLSNALERALAKELSRRTGLSVEHYAEEEHDFDPTNDQHDKTLH